MTTEYTVKRTGRFWQADIFQKGTKLATIGRGDDLNFIVETNNGRKFVLSHRVDGKIRPFSMLVKEMQDNAHDGNTILKIENAIFLHNGQIYIMKNVPEGDLPGERVLGPRYIARLVNFPFRTPEEVDDDTRVRIWKYRGVRVGEMSGLGINGHKLSVDEELEDIGIPLSACSYLIYASA